MEKTDPCNRHLFRRYPGLIGKLPWMPLADLPSPVQKLEKLGAHLGLTDLWMKRDDLNSTLYAGNKPRKFEFIFAEALARGSDEIVTMGSAGSNHGAATCLFCCRLGLQPVLAVSPQPVLSYVRQNILVDCQCQAKFLNAGNEVSASLKIMAYFLKARLAGRKKPYFMYFGGSSRAGNVGFVEAGLELAAQIARGEVPLPRYLFVTTGSCGTHAGLLVGLRLAELPIEVIGVRIVPKVVTNRPIVAAHANRLAEYLHRLDPSIPALRFSAREIRLLDDFYGGQYGRPTPEGKAAIRLLAETEGLPLDPTYTGKSFAGLLAFLKRQNITREPVLYWQTLNGVPLQDRQAAAPPADLAPPLRHYFEAPLYDPEL